MESKATPTNLKQCHRGSKQTNRCKPKQRRPKQYEATPSKTNDHNHNARPKGFDPQAVHRQPDDRQGDRLTKRNWWCGIPFAPSLWESKPHECQVALASKPAIKNASKPHVHNHNVRSAWQCCQGRKCSGASRQRLAAISSRTLIGDPHVMILFERKFSFIIFQEEQVRYSGIIGVD